MPDPQLIAHPVHQPGHCFTCGSSEGPVVDTMVDLLGEGRIYLCARTCLALYARLAGWSSPEEVSDLVGESQRLAGRVQGLEEQLAWERENKVVAVSDMAALVDRMREASSTSQSIGEPHDLDHAALSKGRVVVGGEDVPYTSRPPICSETKVDGTPCTAEALPGRDVCLAHSKRKAAA